MPITVELHIDSKGFTWEVYDQQHTRLASWSMKRDPKGGFRGTSKGTVGDVLTKINSPDLYLEPLINVFEEECDFPGPDDISTALAYMEDDWP